MKIPKRKSTGPSSVPLKKPKTTTPNPPKPPTNISRNPEPVKQPPQLRKLPNIPNKAPTLVDQSPGTSEATQDDDRLSANVVTGKEQVTVKDVKTENDSEPEIIFVKEKENSTPAKNAPVLAKKDVDKVPPPESEVSSSAIQNTSYPIVAAKNPRNKKPNRVSSSQSEVPSSAAGKETSTPIRNPVVANNTPVGTANMNGVPKNASDFSVQPSHPMHRIPSQSTSTSNRLLPNVNKSNHANLSVSSIPRPSRNVPNRSNASRASLPNKSLSGTVNNKSFTPSSTDLLNAILPLLMGSAPTETPSTVLSSESSRKDSGISNASSISIQTSSSATSTPMISPAIPWHSNQTGEISVLKSIKITFRLHTDGSETCWRIIPRKAVNNALLPSRCGVSR